MEACGGYDLSAEAVAAGWCGRLVGAWPGWESGCISGVTAACATAGLDEMDQACWLWACGRDEPAIRRQVWAVLMMEGSKGAASAARRWPKGMLGALVDLALAEMRPCDPRESWTDARRLRALSERDLSVDKSRWARVWRARYCAILDAGWRHEARGRRALAGLRLG